METTDVITDWTDIGTLSNPYATISSTTATTLSTLSTPDILTKTKEIEDLKIPYIIKDKVLMSPGFWNNYTYKPDVVANAYISTDWSNKEIRSLFLDHQDRKSRDWIGEVVNTRQEGNNLIGDLVIVDKDTAIKLAYGAKFGISPKVAGNLEMNMRKTYKDFTYQNFSVVIGPAVKTAYVNNQEELPMETENADITAFEEKRKQLGMSPAEFYAAPRDPPSKSALPIFDESHVRNAMARFNQVQFESDAEKSSAKSKIISKAKGFGIKIDEFEKINKEEKNVETKIENETVPSITPKTELADKKQPPEKEKKPEDEEPEKPEEEEMSEAEIISITQNSGWLEFSAKYMTEHKTATMKEIAKAFKAKYQAMQANKENVLNKQVEELQAKIKEMEIKSRQPDKQTVSSEQVQKLQEETAKNTSSKEGTLSFLKDVAGKGGRYDFTAKIIK